MEKRQRTISLSVVLLRFVLAVGLFTFLLFYIWFRTMITFQNNGIVLHASAGYQQSQEFIKAQESNESFSKSQLPSLSEFALFDSDGNLLDSSVSGRAVNKLSQYYNSGENDGLTAARYEYPDGSVLIISWRYVAEFSDIDLRAALPPFEYLWYAVFILSFALGILLMILRLRRRLVSILQLFSDVSHKVGQQELDFEIPKTRIKEFDIAMGAMDDMRIGLQESLTAQWDAEQKREAEISALAHDLKTPLTIIGGNAELLLEEELNPGHKEMIEAIERNASKAGHYVASMLEAAADEQEEFISTGLSCLLDSIVNQAAGIAEKYGIQVFCDNKLLGNSSIQQERVQRAIENIIINAAQATPAGESIKITGTQDDNSWSIIIEDGGNGFSEAALQNATSRFWRDDKSRSGSGHNGIGLWFANEVLKSHGGGIILSNSEYGGIVECNFPK